MTDALSTDSKGSSVVIPRKDQERCFTTLHQLMDDNKRVFYKFSFLKPSYKLSRSAPSLCLFFVCEFSHTAPEFRHRGLEVSAL